MNLRSLLLSLSALVVGGCTVTSPPALAVSSESGAATLAARSLRDPGLRNFLAENLGRVPSTWDFEALGWVAFYYHPSLGLARAQWATARAAQQSAAARPNPTVSLVPGFNPNHGAGVSPWFPAINLDFLLQTSGKRAHREDIARAEAEAARLAVISAAWQVRSELRAALVEGEATARHEAAFRAEAGVQRELLALLEKRVSAGYAAATEVSAVRLALLRAEAGAVEAASRRAAARARTASALGLPLAALADVTVPLPPSSGAFSAEELTVARRQSLQSRPDVLGVLAKVWAAEAALALEAARQQPDLHLGPGYQWDQGASKWSVALTFELPLFQRNQGPIAEATARRSEVAAQFVAVQAQALATIDAAVTTQAGAAAQVEHARRVRAEVERQNRLLEQRFKLGAADQVELLTGRLELLVAAVALAEAEAGASVAAGLLEDALQIPFSNLAALGSAAPASLTRPP